MTTGFLHGVEVVEIDTGPRPIRIVRSSVIGLIGTAPDADPTNFPLNTPVLIAGSRREAGRLDLTGQARGTLPNALDAIFDQAGAMVVVVRVAEGADTDETMTNIIGGVTAGGGAYTGVHAFLAARSEVALTPRLLIAPGYTHQRITDGITSVLVNSGGSGYSPRPVVSITGSTGSGAAAHAIVAVDGTITGITVDSPGSDYSGAPSVTITDDGGSGAIAVAHVQDGVIQSFTVTAHGDGAYSPGTTVTITDGTNTPVDGTFAPVIEDGYITGVAVTDGGSGYSTDLTVVITDSGGSGADADANVGEVGNPVVAELLGIAERLRGVIIADGPSTDDADAIAYRGDWGSPRVFVVDPNVLVYRNGDYVTEPASPRVAGLIAWSDEHRGFWWSPSNLAVRGIVGTARNIDFELGDRNSRANYLNENEVTTIIREDGFRLWGNRTCAMDPKWAFLSVRRTADIIHESLLRAHLWAVDRNITKTYLEEVTEGVNAFLRDLVARGAILGGHCWPDPELNSPANISQGKVYFNFDFAPPYPAEHVTFRSHLVDDYIEELI